MYRKQFELNRTFPLKIYSLLIALTLLTNIAVQPYQLALQGKRWAPEMSGQIIQSVLLNTIIFSALAGVGLLLATRTGLGLPFLEGLYSQDERWIKFKNVLILSILTGVVVVILVVGIDRLIFQNLVLKDLANQGMELEASEIAPPQWWQALLASFYGGLSEEIQLRLFLLTLLVWLGSRIWRSTDGRPGLGILWVATILAALIFGLGHLPMLGASLAAKGLSLTPILIISTLATNGVGGVILGWLYWSRGLESAMIAHFTADVVLHIVLPVIVALVR